MTVDELGEVGIERMDDREVRDVRVYRFEIADYDGFKHTGLPPGFASERDDSDADEQ